MVRRGRRFESVRGLLEKARKSTVPLVDVDNACHVRALAGYAAVRMLFAKAVKPWLEQADSAVV
jgi:hypothetical protein